MPKLLGREEIMKGAMTDHVRQWHFDSQSIGFMAETIPFIQHLYAGRERQLTVGDIGARTAAGTRLLADMFSPYSNGKLKLNLTAIDIDDSFFYENNNPYFSFLKKDIFDDDTPVYDVCICSHTIEHVPDMYGFIRRVQQLSRDYAIFACPVEEAMYAFFIGHERIVEEKFIYSLQPIVASFYSSNHWLNSNAAIFVLPGAAGDGKEHRDLIAAKALVKAMRESGDRLEALERISENYPQHAATQFEMALYYARKGAIRAEAHFKAAIALDPSFIRYSTRLIGHLYRAMSGGKSFEPIGKPDRQVTIEIVDRALDGLRAGPYPLCVFAEALERANAIQEAADLFSRAGADCYPHGHYRAGLLYKKLGKADAALQSVRNGLAMDPKSADLLWLEAIIQFDLLKDAEAARAPAIRAAEMKRFFPRMTKTAARICDALDLKEEAASWAKLGEDYTVY